MIKLNTETHIYNLGENEKANLKIKAWVCMYDTYTRKWCRI